MYGDLSDLFPISSIKYLFVSGVRITGKMLSNLSEKIVTIIMPGNKISSKLQKKKFQKTANSKHLILPTIS